MFHKKEFPPGHEYEWDRVQRERKEGDPKYLGKYYRHVERLPRPTNQEYKYEQRRL